MPSFDQINPSLDSYWRSVILFGRNSASYKFVLAKSLLELASAETTSITLAELAVPFARNITDHLVADHHASTNRDDALIDIMLWLGGTTVLPLPIVTIDRSINNESVGAFKCNHAKNPITAL